MNHTTYSIRLLHVLAALAFAIAGAAGTGLVPAHSELLFTVDNPCANAAAICNGQLSCPGSPDGTCEEGPQSCGVASWTGVDGVYHYCACAVGGPTVDPTDQPNWKCTLVVKTDGQGNPKWAKCFNGSECTPSEACTKITDINTNCKTCECK